MNASKSLKFLASVALTLSAAGTAAAQTTSELLARLDRVSRTFTGVKVAVRTVQHTKALNQDETETGTITIKRLSGKVQVRIDITGENAQSMVLQDKIAQVYKPQIDEIQEFNLRNFRDLAQQLLALGFGMAGRDLAAGYEIRDVKRETVASQAVTHIELIPKSAEVLRNLKRVELWISEKNDCPVQQAFYFPNGDTRTATYSDVQLNPVLPAAAFDLPKSAKRTRMN